MRSDALGVERDIGRLAKYAFDMGGTGDLLSLSVPPWEDLHELSRAESRLTNLVTTDAVAEVLSQEITTPVAELKPKPTQDRFVSSTADDKHPPAAKSTKNGGSCRSNRRRRRGGAG